MGLLARAVDGKLLRVRDRHVGNASAQVDSVIRWLRTSRRQPFFLFVHGYDPHCPYDPPRPYRRGLVEPYSGPYRLEDSCGIDAFRRLLADEDPGDPGHRHLGELYDAELRAADAAWAMAGPP